MNTKRSFTSNIARLVLLVLVGALAFAMAGCGAEPLVAEEGEFTCAECHIDRDSLKASLEADPLPEKPVAESEGEG